MLRGLQKYKITSKLAKLDAMTFSAAQAGQYLDAMLSTSGHSGPLFAAPAQN